MTQPTNENIRKLLESEEYDDAISIAKSIIKPVIDQRDNTVNETTQSFINSTLPLIFRELFSIEKSVNKTTPTIIDFIYDYVSLMIKFNLPVNLLRALVEGVQNYDQKMCYLQPMELTDDEKDEILSRFFDPSFQIFKDASPSDAKTLINNTITCCFSLGLFNKMLDLDERLTIPQFSLIFRLFYSIENFLNENVVFTLLPYFVKWSLSNLTDLSDDSEDITEMLTSFAAMVPERSNAILQLFCRLLSTGPVNRRLMLIKRIHSMVINENLSELIIERSLPDVKAALFEGSFENANIQLFNQVLDFLPVLSEYIEFTDDDLISILKKVRSPNDQICKCISRIIPHVSSDLEKFAQYFLDSNVYSLDIICLLTSRISNKAMNQSLFELMLNPPETAEASLDNETIRSSFEQNSSMKSLIERKMTETKDPQLIVSLSRIIVNVPNLSGMDEFIKKVINLSINNPSLIATLMTFASVLKTLDDKVSRELVTKLFNLVFSHMDDVDTTFLDQMLPVITEWIEQTPSFDQELILSKLHTISFMDIQSKYIPLITTAIDQSSKTVLFKKLLFKIIYDTVPDIFSNWAINTCFKHYHSSENELSTLVNILSYHLKSEPIPEDLLHEIFPTQQKVTTQKKVKRLPARSARRKKPKYTYDDDDDYDVESEDESLSEDYDGEFEEEERVVTISVKSLKNIRNSDSQEIKQIKLINSIHLLKRCAMYEADFFRIGEAFGTNFEVTVNSTKTQTKLNIGLHPYHTCRRIYAEVAKKTHLSVDKFELQLINKAQNTIETLISSIPISKIVQCSANKIRLSIKTAETGISLKEFNVDPKFLNRVYSDHEIQKILFDLLEDQADDETKPIIIEIMQLFEPFNDFEATSPLQKILLRNYDLPLDFETNKKLFPLALSAYSESEMDPDSYARVIDLAINESFDDLTAVIISKAISRIECPQFIFTPEIIQKGLIENKHKPIRHALLTRFNASSSNNYDDIVSMIPIVLRNEFRENSKEFLMCLKKCDMDSDCFIPFYQDLERYETTTNVDETFISLLRLIPKNTETIRLTYERLSLAPTIRNPQNPFVHSERAREAAFNFLNTDQVYPILLASMALLPDSPSANQKLSDDFTFKNRNGINNLGSTCYINALMQSLNTLPNFVNFILSLPSDGLSLYLRELRAFLAQLRYTRNSTISLKPLIETIDPNFDAFIQHDTEEFLRKLIDRLSDDLEDSSPLKEELELQTKIETYQMDTGEKGCSQTESFLVLPLPTRDLHDLIESMREYFKDQIIEDFVTSSRKKVQAVRKTSTTKWPNCLIIQLQRWDFNVEKAEVTKLVHEFGFPMQFSTEELGPISETEAKYQLSAIIVHEGGIDSGHYFALVNGDTEWYLCNDADIELFDIANIPSWSFGGVKDNETMTNTQITTAYLLFYRRIDTEIHPPSFAPDLEEQINSYNQSTWPLSFFYSNQFLNFARNLTTSYPNNEATTEIALTCLFKIAIVNETASLKWQEHIITNFLNSQHQCVQFFDFIKEKIGTSLAQLINLSDHAYETLRTVILAAFRQLPNTTDPLLTILTSIDFALHKRSILFVCELIYLAYQDLQVNWAQEIDVLIMMVKYITLDMKRDDLFNRVKNQLAEAVEIVEKILANVVLQSGVSKPIEMIYQPDVLERLGSILKSSDSFLTLTENSEAFCPSLVSSVRDAFEANVSSQDKGIPVNIDANFIGGILEKFCFSPSQSIRRNICNILCDIMGEPSRVVENYIKNHVFKPELERPPHADESTFMDLLASLIPIGLKKNERFNEFLDVLVKLSVAAPFATSLSFQDIIMAIPQIESLAQKSPKDNNNIYFSMLKRFMIVVKHLVAYDESLREQVTPEIVKTFLNLDFGCQEALQFVALFHQNSSGSRLFASCISEALRSPYSATSKKITDMVQNGMSPGDFVVPNVAEAPPNDWNNIALATALFECCDSQKDDLKNYILYILQHLKPVETYSLPPFAKAIQMLENHYQMKLNDMMQSLNV